MDAEEILKQLTLEEKAAIVAGTDFMYTNPVPRLFIPPLCTSDGPHGVRKQVEGKDNGITTSLPATAFPTAATTACGWNTENLEKMGQAIGEECRHYGVNVLLGPGINIKKNPLCGRNFEYFSEEPYLAGELAAAEVRGVQSAGVGACVKHFAVNNGENFRFMGDSIVDERAMREIYLTAFEKVVKKASPYAVMCAYNRINGTFCCENKLILRDILRGEWGFDGVVMTDWGAMHDRVAAIKAGLDLEMPGDTKYCRRAILEGVKNGDLKEDELDFCVRNILRLIEKCGDNSKTEADFAAHHKLCAEIAEDCAVLMKNDGILPVERGQRLFICGHLFEDMRYQGAGSSLINPAYLTSAKDAFDKNGVNYEYCKGYDKEDDEPDGALIAEVIEKSAEYPLIIAFLGLTDFAEFEGADREHMRLPAGQLALVDALIKAGRRVVVVLSGGSPVELPFKEGVSAILNMYLSGQNGGTAVYNLLFGYKNPCGKLAESGPEKYEDIPFSSGFSTSVNEVYKESVFVGYRYYTTAQKSVAFPFGFGLSYTTFDYSDINVTKDNGKIEVSCTVTNTGTRFGGEVVQVYVAPPNGGVFRSARELKAFSKVYLKAGQSAEVKMTVETEQLRYWDIKERRYVVAGGEYQILICSDSETVKLAKSIFVEGENLPCPYSERANEIYKTANLAAVSNEIFEEMSGLKIPPLPAKKPITMETRFSEFKSTFWGRRIYSLIMGVPERKLKKAKKMPAGAERDNRLKGAFFMKRILQSNCLRAMSMASPLLPYNFAQGLMEFANGHMGRAVVRFCSTIKAPKLPKRKKYKNKKGKK